LLGSCEPALVPIELYDLPPVHLAVYAADRPSLFAEGGTILVTPEPLPSAQPSRKPLRQSWMDRTRTSSCAPWNAPGYYSRDEDPPRCRRGERPV
jgi:hypothetical protein